MLDVYLSSPASAFQADHCRGQNVLVSFATQRVDLSRWQLSFDKVLVDSGAFSELNTGVKVDLCEYAEFVARWEDRAVAVAGLDDIRGDWRRSLRNYERLGFPTFHPGADPPELLDDLVPIARERGGWLGIGLVPPRNGQRSRVVAALERIPSDLHVHGWALWQYSDLRLDSVDSTAWFRVSWALMNKLPWLTAGECLEISIKQIQRRGRALPQDEADQLTLLSPQRGRATR